MSIEHKQTKKVYDAIRDHLNDAGANGFQPGDIAAKLRLQGAPIATWAIRGELSSLEAEGLVSLNEKSGAWVLTQDTAKKQASC